MSLPKHRIPLKFRALLRERGWSVARLASEVGLPLRRVQFALSGHPDALLSDFHRIASFLSKEELRALGWSSRGEVLPVEHSAPKTTLSHTEKAGPAPSPAVGHGLPSPEGPGTDGDKPLMRNRVPIYAASATGLLPATFHD